MSRISWQRMVTLLVAPLFALAGLVATAAPAQAAGTLVEVETSCVDGNPLVTFTGLAAIALILGGLGLAAARRVTR